MVKSAVSFSGWVTVRHHKGSELLMIVYSNELGSRRQVEEARDDIWKANHFFSSSDNLGPLKAKCCCGIPMGCSCSQASLSTELLSAQRSAPSVKPSSLGAAAAFSEQRVLAKPPTLPLPGCFQGQDPTAAGQHHMDFTCSEAAAPLTPFWLMLLIILDKMSAHSAELKHSGPLSTK